MYSEPKRSKSCNNPEGVEPIPNTVLQISYKERNTENTSDNVGKVVHY